MSDIQYSTPLLIKVLTNESPMGNCSGRLSLGVLITRTGLVSHRSMDC